MSGEIWQYLVDQRMVDLEFAADIFNDASETGMKLDFGDKLFILRAVKEAVGLPFAVRPRDMDNMISRFVERGVFDYRFVERGVDGVMDFFYDNPSRYRPEVFGGM